MTRAVAPSLPSLRSRLALHVMLPLALTWLLGTAVAVVVAREFTAQAFDRSLLDDAYALAANVAPRAGGGVELRLTPGELRNMLFDQSESMFFALQEADGTLVAGHPGLPAAHPDDDSPYRFDDIAYHGKALRAVTLRRAAPVPFDVIMAQTTQSRTALLHRLLVYAIVPQAILLAALGLWIRRSLRNDLRSLAELTHAVDSRGARDLDPIHANVTTTEVRSLAGAINALVSRLSASLAAEREFAGNVAHELRTPLAGIRALADHGLEHEDPALWRAQLRKIAHSGERASRMVDQLLAIAFADEKRDRVELVSVRVDEVVRGVLLDAIHRADRMGVDLGAKGIDAPVEAMGDAQLLEGALSNLVDNALRHGKPLNAGVARVTVEVERMGLSVTVAVVDNGPGLAADERDRLLARWQRGGGGSEAAEGAGGTGLGLAIVARYTELMGARFELRAAAGGGLEARIVLVTAAA